MSRGVERGAGAAGGGADNGELVVVEECHNGFDRAYLRVERKVADVALRRTDAGLVEARQPGVSA